VSRVTRRANMLLFAHGRGVKRPPRWVLRPCWVPVLE